MIRSASRAATQVGALQMRGNVSSSSTTTVVGQVGSAVDRAWWARSRYSDDQRGRREAVKPVEQDLAVRCAPNEPAGFIPRRPSPRTRSSLAPGVHLISKPRTPPGDSAGAYLNNSRSRNRTISQRLHPRDDPPPHRTGHRTHSPEATGPVARVHVPPPRHRRNPTAPPFKPTTANTRGSPGVADLSDPTSGQFPVRLDGSEGIDARSTTSLAGTQDAVGGRGR